MLGNIQYVDNDYGVIKGDERLSRNQIKTRETSFYNISDKYDKYRSTTVSSKTDSKSQEPLKQIQVTGKSAPILRLDEKCTFLPKDSCPTNYVATRAIKLKKAMMDNVLSNGISAYSKDEVVANVEDNHNGFADVSSDDIQLGKALGVEQAAPITLDESTLSKSDISDVIGEEMDKIDTQALVSVDEVAESVDQAFSDQASNEIDNSPYMVSESVTPVQEIVDDEIVSTVPSFTIENVTEPETQAIVENAIEESNVIFDNQESVEPPVVEEVSNEIDASNKYGYVPMTDEQIDAARENIEFQKYEEQYESKEAVENPIFALPAVRDDIIVPEDRVVDSPVKSEKKEIEKAEEEPVQNIHFDYSDTTEKDVEKASAIESTVAGLEALKKRAMDLKKRRQNSMDKLETVHKKQADVAQKALEIDAVREAKKKDYNDRVVAFEEYCKGLEEENKSIDSSIAVAENDIVITREKIEANEAEINSYDDKMKEIDSIMSSDVEGVRRK